MARDRPRRVAVYGLGLMGGAIAANLCRAGFDVQGFDPDPAAAERARRSSVRLLARAQDVDAETRLVLTSLASPQSLHSTVALLSRRLQPTAVVVELSTFALDDKLLARRTLAAGGIELIDAPVSGTGAQAVEGDLSIYASGERGAWDRVADVFAAFARRPHYVGEFGTGTRLKLIANLLVAIHNVAAAEALAMAEAAGIDLALAVELLREGAGGSRIFELRAPLMARGQYRPATMKQEVWRKDMELIADFVRERGMATPVFEATRAVYAAAVRAGPQDDTANVFEVLRKRPR